MFTKTIRRNYGKSYTAIVNDDFGAVAMKCFMREQEADQWATDEIIRLEQLSELCFGKNRDLQDAIRNL